MNTTIYLESLWFIMISLTENQWKYIKINKDHMQGNRMHIIGLKDIYDIQIKHAYPLYHIKDSLSFRTVFENGWPIQEARG